MSVRKFTVYNILGAGLPVFVSLVTIPLYLQVIGDARYGVLAIVWLLLGYFGVFDLGLSRATTNQIARLNEAPIKEREGVFWTALTLNAFMGVTGGLVLYVVFRPLLLHVFSMPEALRIEVLHALPFIAIAVPVATMSGVFSGVLGAREHFGTMNLIQSVGTLLFQVTPLIAAFIYGPNLVVLIAVTVIARIISVLPFIPAVKRALPLKNRPKFERKRVRELLSYGIWVTLSDLITPLLTAVDRFIIAAVSGASAVAYYTVPYNLANRVSILPAALSSALFPRMSMSTEENLSVLNNLALEVVAAVMTPLFIIGIFMIRPFLEIWIGGAFAGKAAPIGILILLGVWSKGLSFVPNNALDARGRPDIIAKLNALEFIVYSPILWLSIVYFGLEGAALSWSLLILVNMAILFYISRINYRTIFFNILPKTLLIVVAEFLAFYENGLTAMIVLSAIILISFSLFLSYRSSELVRNYFGSSANKILFKVRTVLAK